MRRKSAFIIASWIAISVCFSVFVWCLTDTITIGMMFEGNSTGAECEYRIKECWRSAPVSEAKGSCLTFMVPRDAERFRFCLKPSHEDRVFRRMIVCGVPAIDARWLSRTFRNAGDDLPLIDTTEGGGVKIRAQNNVVRVDYHWCAVVVMALFRALRWMLIAMPLMVGVILLARRSAGRMNALPCYTLIVFVLSILSFADPVVPSLPGLDSSWQWLLNHLAFGKAFGRDVVFTYGPLGFILYPQGNLANVVAAVVANSLFALVWCVLLHEIFRSGAKSTAWILLLSMLFPLDNMEWRWVLLSVAPFFAMVTIPEFRSRSSLWIVASALLLTVVTYMKYSSLIIVLATQLMGLVVMMDEGKRIWIRRLLIYFACVLVIEVLFALFLFENVADLVIWMYGSLKVAVGYNMYMVVPKSWFELVLPFVLVLCVGGLVGPRRSLLRIAVMSGPLLFCTIKYALVRQGPTPLMYMLVALSAYASYFGSRPKNMRLIFMVIVMLVIAVAWTLPSRVALMRTQSLSLINCLLARPAFGITPLGIVHMIDLPNQLRLAGERTRKAVEDFRLPEPWRRKIGSSRLMLLPHEFASAMGGDNYHLSCQRTIQMYSSYLPQLDEGNANKLNGHSSPVWLVIDADAYWSGHFINYPLFWSAVLKDYEVVDSAGRRVLMKRNPKNVSFGENCRSKVRTESLRVSQWRDCADLMGHKISFEWHQSALGRIISFFLRNTLVYMEIRYDDGTHVKFQALPENLVNEFDLSDVPAEDEDVLCVLKRKPRCKPMEFRFVVESPMMYADDVVMRINQ